MTVLLGSCRSTHSHSERSFFFRTLRGDTRCVDTFHDVFGLYARAFVGDPRAVQVPKLGPDETSRWSAPSDWSGPVLEARDHRIVIATPEIDDLDKLVSEIF
ncbi:hypothetical protein HPB50_009608 [Hyalomma asiaticum]|uniref:Uncharacterized protein n=1 Tax=Hyalomma asiaticum TaxID=266040 RepID=A0ACB7S5A2_HYAAI|nr:hypothetical protein HPB50_009608 [Hyalomma asiaticum]